MPNILSKATKKILKLSHPLYEQAFEPNMMLRSKFIWQGKASIEFKSEVEKQAFFFQLKDKNIQYIVLCGKDMVKAYEQLKDNSRYSVIHFNPRRMDVTTFNQLHAVMDNKDQGTFFVSQDGYGNNGILLFVLACYQKLKDDHPHLFDIHFYQEKNTIPQYYIDSAQILANFLLACKQEYKEFIQPNPAIEGAEQFFLAIEWILQLIQRDLQKIENDRGIKLKISDIFKEAEKKYQEETKNRLEEKIKRIIKDLSALEEKEKLIKKLKLCNHYLSIMKYCCGENTQTLQILTVALIEKIRVFLLELPFWQVCSLLEESLPRWEWDNTHKRIYDHEIISQQYELYGNEWINKKNYSEAKTWLMLAYLLTDKRETEDRLWNSLQSVLPHTTELAVSAAGTKGRMLLNSLEDLSLDLDASQREALTSFGFDEIKQRRLAGKLFSLYAAMFKLSGQMIAGIQAPSKKSSFFPPVFELNDKVKLALKHLAIYWQLLPKTPEAVTGKKDRVYLVLNDLVKNAKDLTVENQDLLYQKLQEMNVPPECLAFFQEAAKSLYVPIKTAASSSMPN